MKKNASVGLVTGSVVVLLFVGQGIRYASRGASSDADVAMAQYSKMLRDVTETKRQQMMREGVVIPTAEDTALVVDGLKMIASRSSGGTRETLDAVLEVLQSQFKVATPFHEQLRRYGEDQVMNPANLTTPEQIRKARRLTRELQTANFAYDAKLRTLDSEMRAALARKPLSERERTKFADAFVRAAKVNVQLEMRGLTDEMLRLAEQQLNVLESSMGRWSIDPQTSGLLFELDDDMNKFNALVNRMSECATREAALFTQVLNQN